MESNQTSHSKNETTLNTSNQQFSTNQHFSSNFRFPWVDPTTGANQLRPTYGGPGALKPGSKQVPLFSPFKLRSLELKNRIVVSPMCQYSSIDGFYNSWHFSHLGSFAKGGAGLIITEATAVLPEGRISPQDAGIWKDEHVDAIAPIVSFLHSQNAAVAIQLAHAGRKASTMSPFTSHKYNAEEAEGGWKPVGPSAVPWSDYSLTPHELTKKEIEDIKEAFVAATKRSDKAGFDVIELHFAHGYLVSSFNSPIANKRTDEYGGNFEGRTRLGIEIVKAVRNAWPQNKPLFVRLSCSDWVEGGWDLQQTLQLAKIYKSLGVDLIDCSSGGNAVNQKVPVAPSYQVPFSIEVRQSVQIPTGAVGLITEAHQANSIIEKGQADLVLLAREFLRDPHFPLRAAAELGVDVEYPFQYERAQFRKK